MTELRYLPDDDTTTTFEATVTDATESYIVLDGTYFYPEGGGQPGDTGTLSWDGGEATIRDTRKNHGDVRHIVETVTGTVPESGTIVTGEIDEQRRKDLSRYHTAQHVVSRIVLEEYGASTAGNQVYADSARIDFEPADFDDSDIAAIERAVNDVIEQDLGVVKENRPRDRVEENVTEGRALLDMIPDSVDPLRVVEIESFDMCPCGGTHVERLGELGRLRITNRTSKGADIERIEFVLE